MKRTWPLVVTVILLPLFLPTTCPAQLLQFSLHTATQSDIQIAAVSARGRVLLRLRTQTGSDVAARAEAVRQWLTQAAIEGAQPDDVTVGKEGRVVRVKVGETVIVSADTETARLSHSEPLALARQWRDNLAAAFTHPYLAVSTDAIVVPVSEQRSLSWGGAISGEAEATSSAPELVSCSLDQEHRKLYVRGQAPGEAMIKLTVAGVECDIVAEAKYWAAEIGPQAVGQLTGSDLPLAVREQAALNAALAQVKARPGAVVEVRRFGMSEDVWSAVLAASGQGYLPVKREVTVDLDWTAPPQQPIGTAMISNSPEKVSGPAVLLRELLPEEQGARLLWHHYNASNGRLRLVCQISNPSDQLGRVHISWGQAGPGDDEIYVGHRATREFWREWRNAQGYIAQIPPYSAWHFCQQEFAPGQVLSGLAQLQVVSGQGLLVETLATSASVMPRFVEPVAGTQDAEFHLSRFSFPATRIVQLQHVCGGAWTFYHIGKAASHNEHGKKLHGDYGILQDVEIELSNPNAEAAQVEIVIQASGGAARGIFKLDGTTIETGLLRPNQESVLRRIKVAADSSRTVRLLTIPQAGSNYPVTLVVRTIK